MACNTCDDPEKKAEALAVLAFAITLLQDIAPCLAAIIVGTALSFMAGDEAWLHQAAAGQQEDPAYQILTGANVATD
jgi:hypothetical protein